MEQESTTTRREEESLDLQQRISAIRERVAHSSAIHKMAQGGATSSQLGSETPITVLVDIRGILSSINASLHQVAKGRELQEKRTEERHQELCTLLLSASTLQTPMAETLSSPPAGARPGAPGKPKFYFGSVSITSGIHAIGCILMHLDKMMSSHHDLTSVTRTDTTFIDIKDWCNLAGYLLNADKKSKAGLRIPKPSDDDFKTVCSHLASPMEGRRPACDETQIHGLIGRCPEVMNTVEWVRQSVVKCKGVLSPAREFKWKCIEYPFVTDGAELKLTVPAKKVVSKRQFHDTVSALKVTDLKRYMELILTSSVPPAEALRRAGSGG